MTHSCQIRGAIIGLRKELKIMLCVCGACCEGCNHSEQCVGGCEAQQGRVFWTQYIGVEVCPVYQCVKDNGYNSCGDCAKLPCETWRTLKDPATSDAEHQKSIDDRVTKLKAVCR